MPLVTVTPSSVLPISIEEARLQCRVTDSTHDERLRMYIENAAAYVEALTGARLTQQTLRLDLDDFPGYGDSIDLGVYPVTAVTSVKYYDTDNTQITYNAGSPLDYWESLSGHYPKIYPVSGWAATRERPDAVQITMTAGFTTLQSPDLAPMPHDIRHALLVLVSEYFNNSALSVTGPEVFPTVTTITDLLYRHRRHSA